MNCKQGDLAFVTHNRTGDIGKIVFIKSTYDGRDSPVGIPYEGKADWIAEGHDLGLVDLDGQMLGRFSWGCYADSSLRPIRAQPGADETLAWKSIPTPHKEPV